MHPATPPLVFGPAIVLLAVISLRGTSLERTTIAFVSGWIFWTLAEYWIHRADGVSIPVEASAALLPDRRVQIIARDISGRKELDRLKDEPVSDHAVPNDDDILRRPRRCRAG